MATDQKGFFATLFDFSFTSFLTIKFLKLIYGLLVGLIALGAVLFLIVGLSQGGAEALLTLVVVPAVALVYLILVRISMEAVALFFRIGENTSTLVEAAGLPPATGQGHGHGYGQVGPGPGNAAPATREAPPTDDGDPPR